MPKLEHPEPDNEPEDDEEDDESPDRHPPEPLHPDLDDLREQLAKRDAQLLALASRYKEQEEALKQVQAAVKANEGAAETSQELADRPAATVGTATEAPSPRAPQPIPRKDRPRYAQIPEAEKYDLTETEMTDIEHELRRGVRPSEALESIGVPANRYTLDQVRSIDRTLQNRGEGAQKPASPLAGLKDLNDNIITPLREMGLIFTRKDFDDLMEKNSRETDGDPETRDMKELAHVGREIIVELTDAARDITGHPKRGTRVADELATKAPRSITGATIPERALPAPTQPAAAPPAPSAAQAEVSNLAVTHPEVMASFDYLIRLAPRIYDMATQEGPPEEVRENVLKDATVTANLVWLSARSRKPSHLMDSNTGRCVRCNVGNSTEAAGKPCPLGWSQKDLLRSLKGQTVKTLMENISRYQGTVELNSPLDSLGQLSIRQYLFAKKFGPTDDPDLGGNTIFDTITSEVGILWLGRFLSEIDDKTLKEDENAAQARVLNLTNAPQPPAAEARSEG
jgi:hypothetical protein